MSLRTLRATVLRPAAAQRAVMLLGVVLAIVAGLLAMHTIATGMTGHSEPVTAAMAVTSDHHAAGSHTDPAGDDCAGECAPDHDMTTMVCVLALLFGGALLLIGLVRGARMQVQSERQLSFVEAVRALRSAPFRDPPDLLELSISRT